jgi:UDP-2,3-diacylglucosamine hydrolase
MAAFAERKIREGIDIVVMGHRHAPVLQEIGGGVYVNLGDWISHRTYGELSEGTMKLRTWNDHQS